MEEWKTIFAGYAEIMSEASGPNDIDQSHEQLFLKTPKKFREETLDLHSIIVPFELDQIMEQASILPKEQFWWDEEEDVSLLPSSLLSFLHYLRGFIVKYDQWLLQPHDIVADQVRQMEEDIHNIHSYCEGLNSKLGLPICIQGTEFPDIWCAIEFLASALSELNGLDAHFLDIPMLTKQGGELYDVMQVVNSLKAQCTRIEQEITKNDGRFTFI